ncbi:MAG TPA: hypothetical protein VMW14_01255, partial [Candidatus Paceibacterota bacterium]|nr:hypothetical protein [Candidatus Paceibacterota bacterium]
FCQEIQWHNTQGNDKALQHKKSLRVWVNCVKRHNKEEDWREVNCEKAFTKPWLHSVIEEAPIDRGPERLAEYTQVPSGRK